MQLPKETKSAYRWRRFTMYGGVVPAYLQALMLTFYRIQVKKYLCNYNSGIQQDNNTQ
jgi:hypothetical protein